MTTSSQITGVLTSPYRHVASLDYDLPQALVGVWLSCGPEFQLAYDIETDEGADALVFWWFVEGRRGYPGVRDILNRDLFTMLHTDYLPPMVTKAKPVLTPLLSLVYSQRKDLRDAFDLKAPAGVPLLWRWWMTGGQQEIVGEADWFRRVELESFRAAKATKRSRLPSGKALPNELIFVYALHPDFDIETEAGSSNFLMWWLRSGALDFGKMGQDINRAVMQDLHWSYLPKILQTGKLSLTPLLAAAFVADGNHQIRSDVKKKSGITELWRWWLESGSTTYRLAAADLEETLRRASAISNAQFKLPLGQFLPNALVFIYAFRLDLQKAFEIGKETGALALLMWWLTPGSREFAGHCGTVNRALMVELHWRHLTKAIGTGELALTPLLAFVLEGRPDVRQAFDVKTRRGVFAIWRWWSSNGLAELPGTVDDASIRLSELSLRSATSLQADGDLDEITAMADLLSRFSLHEKDESLPAERQSISDSATALAIQQPAEVCLVGYSRGEFGLGEDARLLRAALESKGITPTVVRPSWHITARQQIDDISIDDTQAQFDSDTIFFVMPAFDTVTLLNKVGSRAFSARRKIGFWQWELSNFPPPAKLAMNLVDEIWCHSDHAAEAFRNATDKPVIKVPLPVLVPAPRKVSRKSLGLPPNAFVVFTAYDGASSVSRKNPLGSILAFRQAFTDKGIDACLIVKAMNTKHDSLWRECVRKAAGQPIIIIDEVLDRQKYYELLGNCDAVISLHRAEGFGRMMAEAMMLGIPAIASRYSGNLDFMTESNSWLIDGNLVPLMTGDYPFHHGQHWLEPDIAQAANALRECATNPALRKQRGEAGKRDITARYSIEACGKVYLDLLKLRASPLRTSVA